MMHNPEGAKFNMLYVWIQFYNSSDRPKSNPDKFSERIQQRMYSSLSSIDHKELYTELYKERPTRDKVVVNWVDGNQSFKLVPAGKNGKLRLSNA